METPLSESFAQSYYGHGGCSGAHQPCDYLGSRSRGLPRMQYRYSTYPDEGGKPEFGDGSLSLCPEMFHLPGGA
jgi:hypothetical protein